MNYAYHPTIGLQSARLEHDIADALGRDPTELTAA
jgi:hypothetical protein